MILTRFTPLALALAALAGCSASSDNSASVTPSEAIEAIPAPAGTRWTEKVEVMPDGGVRLGNPDAPIKLVEYGSLSCPACAQLARDGFETLMKDYVGSGRVSLEFRSFMMHPQDVPLTMLARCGPLETYFPLIEQVYANFDALEAPLMDDAGKAKVNAAMQGSIEQRLTGLAEAFKYPEFFATRGLPADKAQACLADTTKAQELSVLTQKYVRDGVNQTPTLLVNGSKLDRAEWTDLVVALKQAGAR